MPALIGIGLGGSISECCTCAPREGAEDGGGPWGWLGLFTLGIGGTQFLGPLAPKPNCLMSVLRDEREIEIDK